MRQFFEKYRQQVLITIFIVIITVFLILIGITISNLTSTAPTAIDSGHEENIPVYTNALYSINYTNETDRTDLTIDAYAGYRTSALLKLQELELDPTDFKITFEGEENPFTAYE